MTALRAILLLLAALAFTACGEIAASPAPAAWLADAEAAHASADAALAGGDREAARAELARFVQAPVPTGMAEADARVVRQDAHWRLAEIALEGGEVARALRHANDGLEEGRAVDVFTANLLVVRGRAKEAKNDPLGAASDYHEALRINDTLLNALLDEMDAP